MKELKALIGMMLKEKLNIKYSWTFKNILRNIVPYIIKIAFVAGISYLLFYLAAKYNIFSFNKTVPLVSLSLIVGFVLILIIVSSIIEFTKNLYFADDNKILLTYPINSNKIFYSKIIVYYLTAFSQIFSFIFPIFLAYGIFSRLGAFYFIWSTISMLFVALVPLVFSVIFSIPTYYIIRIMNRYKIVKVSIYLIVILSIAALSVYIIYIIPNNLNLFYFWPRVYSVIQEILAYYRNICAGLYYLCLMVVGSPIDYSFTYLSADVWITFAALIAIFGLSLVFGYFINHKRFQKISSESLEGVQEFKINRKAKENKSIDSQFLSVIKKEFVLLFRNSNQLSSLLYLYLFAPILTFLVIKIFNALYLSYLGTTLSYAFSILIILVPILTSNYAIASMFSREGRVAINLRTNPLSPLQQVASRLILPLTFSLISLIISISIFASYSIQTFDFLQYLLIAFSAICLQIGTMLFSASRDIDNKKIKSYSYKNSTSLNKNEVISFFYGFAVSVIYSFYFYILIGENATDIKWVSIKLFIFGIIFLFGNLILFRSYVRTKFYDEGESQ